MLVYDFTTRIWRDMHQGAGWPSWTHDSKEIQVEQDNVIVRVRVSDGRITPVIIRRAGPNSLWGEPLATSA